MGVEPDLERLSFVVVGCIAVLLWIGVLLQITGTSDRAMEIVLPIVGVLTIIYAVGALLYAIQSRPLP